MPGSNISRRRFLASTGGLGVGLTTLTQAGAEQKPVPEGHPKTGKEALQRLLEGNKRFVNGKSIHPHQGEAWRKRLVAGQQPFATVLSCSDSRLPSELLFDQGFGDLFVVRVAGNVVAADILGSIQYALAYLHTPLLMVLGHEKCGAVAAALDAKFKKARQLEWIDKLIQLIEPGLKDINPQLAAAAQLKAAIEANVRWSVQQLARLPEAKKALEEKWVDLVGGVYELETGQVRLLA